jgi:hypothetical protein
MLLITGEKYKQRCITRLYYGKEFNSPVGMPQQKLNGTCVKSSVVACQHFFCEIWAYLSLPYIYMVAIGKNAKRTVALKQWRYAKTRCGSSCRWNPRRGNGPAGTQLILVQPVNMDWYLLEDTASELQKHILCTLWLSVWFGFERFLNADYYCRESFSSMIVSFVRNKAIDLKSWEMKSWMVLVIANMVYADRSGHLNALWRLLCDLHFLRVCCSATTCGRIDTGEPVVIHWEFIMLETRSDP